MESTQNIPSPASAAMPTWNTKADDYLEKESNYTVMLWHQGVRRTTGFALSGARGYIGRITQTKRPLSAALIKSVHFVHCSLFIYPTPTPLYAQSAPTGAPVECELEYQSRRLLGEGIQLHCPRWGIKVCGVRQPLPSVRRGAIAGVSRRRSRREGGM